ncbi:DUF1707 SHOCT-like domain-containing protein [Microlunatus parietis]|uniref:DUF1707 domain-containing protein n=1 Tax=Microlunatus parietis TaxID=682979 RepID=A0A7Y9LCP2_9ACTN|nr:DUF1707 domain-containing protein [Microlunatus parietis]NYE71131.1 hypothetical protein [Microlunatus parietis]
MSELPISSPYRSKPAEPVSDDERDRLSRRLNAAFTDGALSQEEYQSRLDRLFAAQRLGELVPVVEGLPPLQTYDSPAIVDTGTGRPGELTEARSGNRVAVIAVGAVIGVVALIAILLVLIIAV